MFKRASIVAMTLGLALAASCKKSDTTTPTDGEDVGEKTANKGVSEDNEDNFVPSGGEEGGEGGEVAPASEDMDAATAKAEAEVKRPPMKEVCKTVGKGKAKKKECTMVDSDPKLSAQIGVKALMKGYEWGMSPENVLTQLARSIEAEYGQRQKDATDANAQDRNRNWKKEQLDELRRGNVKFTANSKHKWGVSLIQFDFADDNGEEMIWTKSGANLRKFFFFKDGGLWKVIYAYNKEKWPGKEYEVVVDESFKKWFGPSPEAKVKQDPKTAAPLLRYYEWSAKDGEKIRSFDLTAVHGVVMLTVIDSRIEASLGERLPNIKDDESFSSDVGDVLGGSDVEYDKDGNIIKR
jgi:hypothetical protein